ncbi:hypothetical protein KM043_016914 [Ampulex compressa]|nr:hypothetical protein KM043_016914 [Ampulex compressa]
MAEVLQMFGGQLITAKNPWRCELLKLVEQAVSLCVATCSRENDRKRRRKRGEEGERERKREGRRQRKAELTQNDKHSGRSSTWLQGSHGQQIRSESK